MVCLAGTRSSPTAKQASTSAHSDAGQDTIEGVKCGRTGEMEQETAATAAADTPKPKRRGRPKKATKGSGKNTPPTAAEEPSTSKAKTTSNANVKSKSAPGGKKLGKPAPRVALQRLSTNTHTRGPKSKTTSAAKKVTKQTVKGNVNKRNKVGETPLQLACIRGDVDRVRMLLEAGADVNNKDNNGWTPLHEVCFGFRHLPLSCNHNMGARVHAAM